ncbi:MAG TPA: pyridoxamine 5'-phosphate oxidase family protein [Arenibaculum sp.]|nr:pyridoxamine 5'-phosphate oxidase family protein [Arenibaculum sp.]
MTRAFTRLAFRPAVKAAQERYGTRGFCRKLERAEPANDLLTADAAEFIRRRDAAFIATASGDGWPHVQHRGGPVGFLKVLDERTVAFGDFDGNRQLLTVGNILDNPRTMLLLVDFAAGRRMKVWARARIEDDRPDLLALLADPAYPEPIARAIVLDIQAWDMNCRRHIRRRFDEDEVAGMLAEALSASR